MTTVDSIVFFSWITKFYTSVSHYLLITKSFIAKSNTVKENGNRNTLECGPMPNVMVALPNTGGALCSTPQSLADAHY